MYKALYLRDNTEALYLPRKEGRRGLASIQDSVKALMPWLKDYKNKHEGRIITAIRNNTDNSSINRTDKKS